MFAIATEDGWVMSLTCGVSEVFYPGEPIELTEIE